MRPPFCSNSVNILVSRASLAIHKANSNSKSNLVLKDHSKSHILPVPVKPAIPMSVSNFCVSSKLSNSSDAIVLKKPSFNSYSFKSSSKFSSSKIATTPKPSISVSPRNRNKFSYSIPSVIKSNDSKPAETPSQTSHLLLLLIKSKNRLFQPSTQACQSFFLKIRKCLILPPYFKFLS